MGFQNIPGHNPAGRHWQGYDWSEWYEYSSLAEARRWQELLVPGEDDRGFDNHPALCRFRVSRRKALLYIGQTGRTARIRLRGHWRRARMALGEVAMRPDAHLLGLHRGLARLSHEGHVVEFSWTAVPRLSKGDRLGIEAELIAAYRATLQRNPDYQWAAADDDEDEDL